MLAHALDHLPFLVAAWVFGWGVYGLLASRHLVHQVVCLAVVQTASYVLLLGIGYRTGATAPVLVAAETPPGTRACDPVVQAMMLTDVVVEATVMALLLALAVQIHRRSGHTDAQRLGNLRG